MNAEILLPFIKQALANSLASGTSTLLEEFADGLPLEQLKKLIVLLQRVEKKKSGTLDART